MENDLRYPASPSLAYFKEGEAPSSILLSDLLGPFE